VVKSLLGGSPGKKRYFWVMGTGFDTEAAMVGDCTGFASAVSSVKFAF